MDEPRLRAPLPAALLALAAGRCVTELRTLTYAAVRPRRIPLPPGWVPPPPPERGPMFPHTARYPVPRVALDRHTTATLHTFRASVFGGVR